MFQEINEPDELQESPFVQNAKILLTLLRNRIIRRGIEADEKEYLLELWERFQETILSKPPPGELNLTTVENTFYEYVAKISQELLYNYAKGLTMTKAEADEILKLKKSKNYT